MKVYKTQAQVEKDIKNGVLAIDGDVRFECSINIEASINARNINARDITARNINARDITAWDIDAWDIDAGDITARNINARDINAGDINARNINARDILYYAVCFAYQNIKCLSIKGKREVSKHFCLDGEITFKNDNSEKKQELIDKAEELKIKADELLEKAEEL